VEIDLSQMEVPSANTVKADTGGDTNTDNTKDIQVSQNSEATVPPDGGIAPSKDVLATPSSDIEATPSSDVMVTPTKDTAVAQKEDIAVKSNESSLTKKEDAIDKDAVNEIGGAEKYTATDTSYTSDSKTINIKKVVTGQDADTVTYYVADIMLTDATQMKSAFAKNKFGLNIIEGTSIIAKENSAILAINGDYYGFRKDGIEIRNGMLFRNKPARTGLAFYKDGSVKVYDEKQTTGEELLANGVLNTVSFGPALMNEGQVGKDLDTYEVDTNFGNHPIQGTHPRTGIGIIDNNHFVFVVVDGRSKGYSKGATLEEFAKIFQDLGCKTAYNLDGGGSSTMYFMDKRINKPCGKDKERGTSDIIYIK
jgi:exopolysaccharide biosynthesis protein